jgi:hypothetical protein
MTWLITVGSAITASALGTLILSKIYILLSVSFINNILLPI